MKRIVLILLLVPVLLLSGNSAPVETNEVGEPLTPDYTTWQKDVKNVMMDLKDVPEDFFEPAQCTIRKNGMAVPLHRCAVPL